MGDLPTTTQVEAWLAEAKRAIEDLSWSASGASASKAASVTLNSSEVQDGEIVLILVLDKPRWWTFKMRWNGRDVLRWDFRTQGVLARHRNPPESSAPGLVRDSVHEHLWDEEYELRVATGIPDVGLEHLSPALDRFLQRATLVLEGKLHDPPPVQEGLSL